DRSPLGAAARLGGQEQSHVRRPDDPGLVCFIEATQGRQTSRGHRAPCASDSDMQSAMRELQMEPMPADNESAPSPFGTAEDVPNSWAPIYSHDHESGG